MLFDIFRLLIESAAGVVVFALLLRALMQWVRLHPRNPLAPFVFSVTDWAVRPLRRVVPGFAGLDWASLLAAFLVAAALNMVLLLVRWATMGDFSSNMSLARVVVSFGIPAALVWLLKSAVYLLMGIVMLQVVLSWVNPNSPIASVLDDLSRPFLDPLRRVLPTLGNVDLSPMVLFLLLQILMIVVQQLSFSFLL
jgi:YggT family protein